MTHFPACRDRITILHNAVDRLQRGAREHMTSGEILMAASRILANERSFVLIFKNTQSFEECQLLPLGLASPDALPPWTGVTVQKPGSLWARGCVLRARALLAWFQINPSVCVLKLKSSNPRGSEAPGEPLTWSEDGSVVYQQWHRWLLQEEKAALLAHLFYLTVPGPQLCYNAARKGCQHEASAAALTSQFPNHELSKLINLLLYESRVLRQALKDSESSNCQSSHEVPQFPPGEIMVVLHLRPVWRSKELLSIAFRGCLVDRGA